MQLTHRLCRVGQGLADWPKSGSGSQQAACWHPRWDSTARALGLQVCLHLHDCASLSYVLHIFHTWQPC